MSRYKIGVTEAGDAGIDLSWVEKLARVDGAIVITKKITNAFVQAVAKNKDKLVVHATVTGYGGTVLEPNVPTLDESRDFVQDLLNAGFSKHKTVIRVDPIIPTKKGLATAERVMKAFIDGGFYRFRVSVLDNYPHVCKRFREARLPVLYNGNFMPTTKDFEATDAMLASVLAYASSKGAGDGRGFRLECCAEPNLRNATKCGCISAYDLSLLGLDTREADDAGVQRRNCMCYSGKTELLEHKQRCPNGCLYCYWR